MAQKKPGIVSFLPLIRLAMLVTVIVVGGVLWFVLGDSNVPSESVEDGNPYNLIFLVLIAMVAGVIIMVRSQVEQKETLQQKAAFVLLGWSAAEGAALVGALFSFLANDRTLFFAGLLLMLMTFMVVKIPQDNSADV